jgi:predicted transcriptional regulator
MKPASEIARDLGLNERTTQHILKQNFTEICGESSKVAELIDRNNELQSMADALLKELIQSKDVKA